MPTKIERTTVAPPDALWAVEVSGRTLQERHVLLMAAIDKLRQDFQDITDPDVASLLSVDRSLVLYNGKSTRK